MKKIVLFLKKHKIALLVLGFILGFVGYNLYAARDIETIDQRPLTDTTQPSSDVQPDTQSRPETIASGVFSGKNGYSVTGDVNVVTSQQGNTIQFSDDFTATAGPDLLVYLSENNVAGGEDLGEFVSLGGLRAQDGAQTYLAPENIDQYKSVVIWCRAFDVQFGSAEITN